MMLIKDAKLVDETIVDVLINDDKIVEVNSNISKENHEIIDAKQNYLLPGLVDLNIRLKDDKLNLKNIDELEKRAINAGITTLVLNCDFEPRADQDTFFQLLEQNLKTRKINILLNIKGLNTQEKLNDISILLKSGAKVISENSDISTNNLRRLAQYSLMHKVPLFIFCQNRALNKDGVINESILSNKLGLPGILKIGEISEVAKVASLSSYYKSKTLFQSISTRKSLDIIANEKKDFKELYSEVSIHHLLKTDLSCENFNTYAKITPPLRTNKQRELLIDALQSDMIDTITSLFSPKSIIHKDLPFELAKFGIDELEDFLPLLYTNLVQNSTISMQKLQSLTCTNPSNILGVSNSIEKGNDANLIIFDPNKVKTSHDKRSIYNGDTISGKIITTISKGKVYQTSH